MTTTVLNTKISEAENNITDTSSLVTTTVLNTKISEVENKTPNHDAYITGNKISRKQSFCLCVIYTVLTLHK